MFCIAYITVYLIYIISYPSAKIELEWMAEDEESSLYDFEVAIGTSKSTSGDVVPFQSTRGHSRYLNYHSGLKQDVTFYVHIKAINLAQLTTTKVEANLDQMY